MTNQDKEFMFAFLFFPIIIDFTEICTPNACIHVCIYKNATLNKIWEAFEIWLSELLLLIVYGQTSFFQSQFVFCQFFNGKSICERNRFVISDTFARKN